MVRDAFIREGHNAVSVDILPSESALGPHIVGDVLSIIVQGEWDLMVAHPPCTYLAVSGARWWKDRRKEQAIALDFACNLMEAPIERIALENPIGYINTAVRRPDQIIQPWMFGHGETKATCLWLKGLPKLVATNVVDGREARVHKMPPGPDRWKNRSRTFTGIADAMAKQWGGQVA